MASTATQSQNKKSRTSSVSDRFRNVQVGLFVLGAVLLPFGLLVIGLGWYGSAHTPYLYNQMSYLVSGGLMGLGLTFAGGFLYFGAWLAKMAADQRDASRELTETMSTIASLLGSEGHAVAMPSALTSTRTVVVAQRPAPVADAPSSAEPAATIVADPHATAELSEVPGRHAVSADGSVEAPEVSAEELVSENVASDDGMPPAHGFDDDAEFGSASHFAVTTSSFSPMSGVNGSVQPTSDVLTVASMPAPVVVHQDSTYTALAAEPSYDTSTAIAVEDGAALVTVGSGTTVHRRDCQLIAHRTDIYAATITDDHQPPTCRVCRPEI